MDSVSILILAAMGIGFVLFLIVQSRRMTAEFNAKFPPISDEEFLARCRPGTNPEVALKVRRIISKQLGIESERIYPSSSFVEDLGAD
jgi:hypothetical protein